MIYQPCDYPYLDEQYSALLGQLHYELVRQWLKPDEFLDVASKSVAKIDIPYVIGLDFWRRNWHWLIWTMLFLSGVLAMGLYQLFGPRWIEVPQQLLNLLTSPCITIFIALPIAVAILAIVLGAIKK